MHLLALNATNGDVVNEVPDRRRVPGATAAGYSETAAPICYTTSLIGALGSSTGCAAS